MFYDCFLLPVSLASFQYFFVFWFTVFGLSFFGLLLSSEILSAFRVPASGLFWNFQGCITVYLSRFGFDGLKFQPSNGEGGI